MAEISVQPDDFPSGDTSGYMNIITWAASAEDASDKLSRYFSTFDWHLLKVESVCEVTDLVECSEEMEDIIDRAKDNANAIILGTFHSYKTN